MILLPLAIPPQMSASPVMAAPGTPLPAWHRPHRCMRRAARQACLHLLGALLLCDTAQALTHDALPAGAQVREGGIAITSDARGMQIRQDSEFAIIDWRSFDIGRDVSLRIRQHANAALLNRVLGDTPSTIAGELSATSMVYLVNPNGIHISATGSVRAVGFVAATLDVTDADFLNRELRFGSPARTNTGTVGLDGTITAEPCGFVALLGHRVEQRGTIRTLLGQTGLGAGQAITVAPGQDTFLDVMLASERAPADLGAPTDRSRAAIVLSGIVEADGGLVQIAAPMRRASAHADAINLGGVVRARHALARAGTVLIHADGGIVRLTGRLDASGYEMRGTGGIVEVGGRQVLMEGGSIDVGGEEGGGYAWVLAHHADGEEDAHAAGRAHTPDEDGHVDPPMFVGVPARVNAGATYQGSPRGPAHQPSSQGSSLQSSLQSSPASSAMPSADWHPSPGTSAVRRAGWQASPAASSSSSSPSVSSVSSSSSPPVTPSPTAFAQGEAISRAGTVSGHRPDEPVAWLPPIVRAASGNGTPPPGLGS